MGGGWGKYYTQLLLSVRYINHTPFPLMVTLRTPWTTHKPGVEWKQGVLKATALQK